MKKMEATLLLLRKDNQILLGKKKSGFGTGKYNGVGGKLELNETPEQAMIRETIEEINIIPIEYEKVGVMDFIEFMKGEKTNIIFHLYVATKWEGIPTETEEIKPYWFDIENLPYEEMFENDKYWLPYILEGKKVNGFFEFDEEWNLISYRIEEIIK